MFTGLAILLADMDVLLSFADLSSTSPTPYVRPSITPSVSSFLFMLILVEGSSYVSFLRTLQRYRKVSVHCVLLSCFSIWLKVSVATWLSPSLVLVTYKISGDQSGGRF